MTELLVVLSVLGVLACLLVSAQAGGKDQSYVAQCAGNLRQFALALDIYAGENNEKLPVNSLSNWAWDLGWSTGTVVTQWISFRQLYCPGTSIRFTDQDNVGLWNFGAPSTLHVIGYALTLPGTSGVMATNINSSLTPQRISFSGLWLPAPSPASRPVLADGTISENPAGTAANPTPAGSFTYVLGGFPKAHLSPHLNGTLPAGGNVAMLDGHTEWRPFNQMIQRSISARGFWW